MAQIILSSDVVKPSSPTPLASKTHKLSFIDQIQTSFYIPLIFFYDNNQTLHVEEISRRLKQSLSEILRLFYPLAGTIRDNSYFDCDDRGVGFMEARVGARLSQFTENPKTEELEQLLPADSASYDDDEGGEAAQLLVKITSFDCGGIAVGVCFSHMTGDFSSCMTFMHAWAATCRGEISRVVPPLLDLALRFPPKEGVTWSSGLNRGITREKILTRRLVFNREKVEKLRKSHASSSRVEALTAFIWRSFIRAHRARSGTTAQSFPATHAVNFRPRAAPPLPEHAFGNCWVAAVAVASPKDDEGVLVSKLGAAIRAVDRDYMDGFTKDGMGTVRQVLMSPVNCMFSSWWKFPIYEVDFGWGKPARVCTATMPCMNLVILMPTPPSRDDGGVEAWVNVADEQFFRLLQDDYDKMFA